MSLRKYEYIVKSEKVSNSIKVTRWSRLYVKKIEKEKEGVFSLRPSFKSGIKNFNFFSKVQNLQ